MILAEQVCNAEKKRSEMLDADYISAAAYHAGEPPDDRTLETLEKNDIFDYDHDARRVSWPCPRYTTFIKHQVYATEPLTDHCV